MQSAALSVTSSDLALNDGTLVHLLRTLVGAIIGLALGVIAGFGTALVAMSFDPRSDGTYGMREMLVCLPSGALAGLATGIAWGRRRRAQRPERKDMP